MFINKTTENLIIQSIPEKILSECKDVEMKMHLIYFESTPVIEQSLSVSNDLQPHCIVLEILHKRPV